MDKELIMYSRSYACSFVTLAKAVLDKEGIPFHEIFIDKDREALDRVVEWTGFRAVPTLVAANAGEVLPYESPDPLPRGHSPRGVNRGSMITEPDKSQLRQWLQNNGFVNG